jgi:hypothetical protein
MTNPEHHLAHRMSFERWLGIIIVTLSVMSVIYVAIQTARLNDVTVCQAEYNDAYTTAIQERSMAARRERQAQREMLLAFLGGESLTPAEGRAVFDRYLAALDEADQVRDSADIPTRRC